MVTHLKIFERRTADNWHSIAFYNSEDDGGYRVGMTAVIWHPYRHGKFVFAHASGLIRAAHTKASMFNLHMSNMFDIYGC